MVAAVGVVGAAAYALRLYIQSMHNRVGPRVASRDIALTDGAVIVPIVLVILVLAFFPQFGLQRSQPTVRTTLAGTTAQLHSSQTTSTVAQAP